MIMKIDKVVESLTDIPKNSFIKVAQFGKFSWQYSGIVFRRICRFEGPSTSAMYTWTFSKFPAVTKLYQYSTLPIWVRIISFFLANPREVFTAKELVSRLECATRSASVALSIYFPSVKVLGKGTFYGCSSALKMLEAELKKRSRAYIIPTKVTKPLIIRIQDRDRCFVRRYSL